ncbi:MAG: GAF domain-containing protein, partial [Spirochaetales bacterium]|nr:GAF domain-containing protein [Spirochaetales bacterium]
VVDDVRREDNYLACSLRVRSEIVVPVFRSGAVVAEIDIDSHRPAAFGADDRAFLESLAVDVAPFIPDLSGE